MFGAIVGVFTAIVDVVPSEDAPWMISDLLLDGWMLSQEFSYFLMFVEIFAVIYQLRICL